jgi:hypothetical protein
MRTGEELQFLSKTSGLRLLLLPGISRRYHQDHRENKTAISPSKKQNAVLTLPRDANYKSCRTQNSSRTALLVAALNSVQEQSMAHFEEATA